MIKTNIRARSRNQTKAEWPAAILLAACFLLAACEPVYVFPGGALSGTEQPPPANWEFAREVSIVQLETRPTAPYSVNIWGVGVGSNFYVASGDADSKWVHAIAADPRVRLRIGEHVYSLIARPIGIDAAEFATVLDAYVQKYDLDREENFASEAKVYRLEAR